MWARERNLIPGVGATFELPTWEAIGQRLWKEISSGDKTAGRFCTLWWLVRGTLQEMKSERIVATSAFAALTPATPSASGNAMLLSNDAPNLFENRIRMPPLWTVKETTVAETRDGEIAERASEEIQPEKIYPQLSPTRPGTPEGERESGAEDDSSLKQVLQEISQQLKDLSLRSPSPGAGETLEPPMQAEPTKGNPFQSDWSGWNPELLPPCFCCQQHRYRCLLLERRILDNDGEEFFETRWWRDNSSCLLQRIQW